MIRVNNPTIFDTISISSNQKLLVSLKNKIDLSKGKVNLSSLSAGGTAQHLARNSNPLDTTNLNKLGLNISKSNLLKDEKDIILKSVCESYLKSPSKQQSGASCTSLQSIVLDSLLFVYGTAISYNNSNVSTTWSSSSIDIVLHTSNSKKIYISHKSGNSTGGAVSNAFSVGYNECDGFIKSNYSADEYYIFLFEYALGATVNQKDLFNNLIKNHRPNANVFFNLNDMYTFLDQV